jgi:hypothetical protein
LAERKDLSRGRAVILPPLAVKGGLGGLPLILVYNLAVAPKGGVRGVSPLDLKTSIHILKYTPFKYIYSNALLKYTHSNI